LIKAATTKGNNKRNEQRLKMVKIFHFFLQQIIAWLFTWRFHQQQKQQQRLLSLAA